MRRASEGQAWRRTPLFWLAWLFSLALVPTSLLLLELAFLYPAQTERFYGGWLYPLVATALGRLNGFFPFSLAQGVLTLAAIAGVGYVVFHKRSSRGRARLATALKAATILWIGLGVIGLWFVVSWGLNYARPSLEKRLDLSTREIRLEEVLDAGRRSARRATELHEALNQPIDQPTRLTLSFSDLNDAIDRRLGELRLPGDRLLAPHVPRKEALGLDAPLLPRPERDLRTIHRGAVYQRLGARCLSAHRRRTRKGPSTGHHQRRRSQSGGLYGLRGCLRPALLAVCSLPLCRRSVAPSGLPRVAGRGPHGMGGVRSGTSAGSRSHTRVLEPIPRTRNDCR